MKEEMNDSIGCVCIALDVSDYEDIMLPFFYMQYITRWIRTHPVSSRLKVWSRGSWAALVLENCPVYLEEALMMVANTIGGEETEIYVVEELSAQDILEILDSQGTGGLAAACGSGTIYSCDEDGEDEYDEEEEDEY